MQNFFLSAVERILKPAIFCYDFKSPRAGLSYIGSREWIFLWLLVDVCAQLVLESGAPQGTNTWLGLGIWLGTAGTFILLWKLPPLLGATLAGLGMFRAMLSLGVLFATQGTGLSTYTPTLLLVVQGWMLCAYGVLILSYIRTPKKEMPEVRWPTGMKEWGRTLRRPWWG